MACWQTLQQGFVQKLFDGDRIIQSDDKALNQESSNVSSHSELKWKCSAIFHKPRANEMLKKYEGQRLPSQMLR